MNIFSTTYKFLLFSKMAIIKNISEINNPYCLCLVMYGFLDVNSIRNIRHNDNNGDDSTIPNKKKNAQINIKRQ